MSTPANLLATAIEHHSAGRLADAEQIYLQIIAADANHADALHLLGVIASQQGQYGNAAEHISRAIALKPLDAVFHSNLGDTFIKQGKLDEAIASCRRALELKPNIPEAHNNLGNALKSQKNLDEAIASYRRALELRPAYAEAHSNLGAVLNAQGKLEEAVTHYRRAIELAPGFAEAHNNLGHVLEDLDQLDEAITSCRTAIALQPNTPEAHNNLGNALKSQKNLDEAIASYRRALELRPAYAEAHSNLGAALNAQGKLEEAVTHYRRAIELAPGFAEGLNNLGNTLKEQGKLDEAFEYYRRALELKPDYARAHTNRGIAYLLSGDFERGWLEFEWRWRTKAFKPREFKQPLWDGSSLAGRTILVHSEQGLGDSLHFVRYLPLVRQRGARVIFECQAALHGLFETARGIDELVKPGEPLPHFDAYAPLMSLPLLLGLPDPPQAPRPPYLSADTGLVAQWKRELDTLDGFKVGIHWQGNPQQSNDRQRSFPLAKLLPLAKLRGVRLISLQKGFGSEQLRALPARDLVVDLGPRLDETTGAFMDTAAVLENLDLVITSDTALAHLAGALGKTVWLALSAAPDWRWGLSGRTTTWYPSMRLFRQTRLYQWDEVFQTIANELTALAADQIH